MSTNFLEELAAEWYEYQGYFIRCNVLVGKRSAGGHECELDVVAFHPQTRHLVHVEASMDATSWEEREKRYKRKFEAGIKYIPELFTGLLNGGEPIEQIALLVFSTKGVEKMLGGGKLVHVSELLHQIVNHFTGFRMIKKQAPEQFPVLRAIQFTTEYRRELFKP